MPLSKRRLTDLWQVGKELTLDDGSEEDPIAVWCQKLSPVEQAEASRHADAARARYLALQNESDSDEYQQQMGSVLTFGESKREMAEFITGMERQKVQQAATLRISAEEGWEKDGYLQGLYDAWEDQLKARWLADNDDEEAARCMAELERFNKQVAEAVEDEMDPLIEVKLELPLARVREEMVQRLLEIDASSRWMEEYFRWQLFFGVREPEPVNHRKRYFANRGEVDDLSLEAFKLLRDVFLALEVEPSEGKSLPGTRTSSASSEPQAEEEMEPSSGPMVAAQ